MNFYGGKELAASFRTVRKNTLLIAEDIPEDKYGFKAASECRSVSQALVHIAISNRFQHRLHAVSHLNSIAGYDFSSVIKEFNAEESRSRTKAEILELLRTEGDKFSSWLEGLTDEFLGERVTMPPGQTPSSKSRFEMLLGVKEHEMHHRGQLMLIERILGIVPHLTREREGRASGAQAGGARK